MAKKIKITSSNPDLEGTWTKAETEEEMRELDNAPKSPNDWIEWTLDHVFMLGDYVLPGNIYNAIAYEDSLSEIVFKIDGDMCKVIKM